MGRKFLLVVITAAALVGLHVSGCNRDSVRTASRGKSSRTGDMRAARPAEVLSASAYRPPRHVYAAAAPGTTYAYVEPVPAYRQPAARQAERPAYAQPAIAAPHLAMAQGYAAPIPAYQPTHRQPQIRQSQYPSRAPMPASAMYAQAPIPELEPMRAYRLPVTRNSLRPVAEVMVSDRSAPQGPHGQTDYQEVRRALAPLSPTPVAHAAPSSWVSSPTTAMYQTPGRW